MKRLPTSSRGSVLAVSHDFDGFVRRRPCGLVASHYRPWGLPGFRPTADVTADTRPSSRTTDPSKLFPPDEGGPVTTPLLVCLPDHPPLSWLALFPSVDPAEAGSMTWKRLHLRGFPAGNPLLPHACCSAGRARCSLGLLLDLGLSPVRSAGDGHEPWLTPTLFGARLSPAPPVRSTRRSESSEACDPFAPGPFDATREAEAPVASK